MRARTKVWTWLVAVVLAFATVALGATVALADAGDTPGHSKTLTPNETSDGTEDGTYKLELSVTGDADDETQEAGSVNIVVVYDISGSMTLNAGTSRYTRADQAEDVVHDFLTNLARYQNDAKNNINVSLVTFAGTANQAQEWTTGVTALADRFDDGGTNGRYNFTTGHGTNWEDALQHAKTLVQGAPGNGTVPTFVIMVTDGAPTASIDLPNYIPANSPVADLRERYDDATDESYAIASACEATGGTFYGIYTYGTEADLLDDLMYYSENNQHRGSSIDNVVAATQDAPNYFNTGETAQLQEAFDEIFDKVVQAMGISSVSISDGTTHEVETSSGDLELLEVDESSYQYWLRIPLDSNNQFQRVKGGTGPDADTMVTYTVSSDGSTVTWGSNSVTVDGEIVTEGGKRYLKYEWTGANALYDYEPPEASLNGSSVDWDLSSVGTLLDGVTYSVTFDVYPSQTTLDYIADIKNGLYDSLPAEVKPYIHADGTFDTNTTATLNWKDTRNDPATSGSTNYENPDPVSSSAVELLSVAKEWKNGIDGQTSAPIVLDVTRDGTHKYDLAISSSTSWQGGIYVSIGLMRTNEETGEMEVLAQGHDFTFEEPEDIGYYWDIDVPVVHPMMIDGVLTMLIKVDEKHPAPSGAETYTFDDFEGEYYVGEAGTASLTATNYRRSRLNLTKAVEGDAPAGDKFPFTLSVVNSNEAKGDPDNLNSDAYVWFSIRDASGARVTDTGYVISGATAESGNTGYYYAESGEDISVSIPADYTVSFINIPAGSTYTFTEGTLASGYIFKSSELTEGVDDDFSDGQTSEGTVVEWNSEYLVTFTNEYAAIDVTVTKTWDDNGDQDKVRPTSLTLTLNGLPSGTTAPTPTVNKSGDTWTYTWKGVPKYDASGNAIQYTVTEDAVPEHYECATPTANPGGTITNKHTPETTEATVKKVWDDANDQDGIRPESLTVTLSNGDTVTLSESNQWSATVGGLPKYANGQEVAYTWTEGTLPEGYSMTSNTKVGTVTTITNKHTPETTEATVKKVWDDANDQDGIRPESLTVTLSNGDTVTLSESNQWSATVGGLPKYANGQEVAYTWTEGTLPEGYSMTSNTKVGTVTTITNKHTPETTEATVKKVWDDANDQDGKRPESLTVTLSNGDTVTLSESNQWSATVGGLPKYANGQEVAYTWEEGTLPEGYSMTSNTKVGTVTTITNKHTPETTEATVKKVWDDANDQDGIRPESLTVTLSNGDTVTLSESNQWSATVGGLPKYANGQEVAYTWTEGTLPEGYSMTSNTKVGTVTTITNKHTPETTEATVKKVWDDANDQDGKRPESLTVTLSNGDTVTLSESNQWSATVGGLPKYANGQEVAYTWEEGTLPEGYSMTSNTKVGTVTTITNKHTPETTEATVKKVWVDDNNAYNTRPESLTVTLSNGDTVTLSESNQWSATVGGLPKYANGQEVAYTWTEGTLPAGYELTGTSKAGTVTTITNTYSPNPATASIPVSKVLQLPTGTTGPENAKWTVTLTTTNNAPMPDVTELQLANGESGSFGAISYPKPGTYVYTLTETGTYAGVTNDTAKQVTVTVKDDGTGTGTLTAEVSPSGTVTFNNEYKVTPTTATIEATKVLEGAPLTAGAFTFKLTPVDGAPIQGSDTTSNDAAGKVAFDAITFSAPGTYVYEITEEKGDKTYITYDAHKVTATVTVSDNHDGTLGASVAYSEDKPTFTNTYNPEGDEFTPTAQKKLNVRTPADGQFTFELVDEAGKVIQTKSNDASGAVKFDTITYDLSIFDEDGGSADGGNTGSANTEDDAPAADEGTEPVGIADEATDEVVADEVVADEPTVDDPAAEETTDEFVADEPVEEPAATDATAEDAADEPSPLSELANALGLNRLFAPTLAYADEVNPAVRTKTFTYTIREVNDGKPGYSYDGHEVTYTVTVTDDYSGKLKVTYEVSGDTTFTNTYTASGSATISGTKTLEGADLTEGQFSFELRDSSGEVIQTAQNDAEGNFAFEAIEYDQDDVDKTFTYTLTEVNGGKAGYTYDDHKCTVEVKVTDEEGNGKLTTTVTYAGGSTFTNTYQPIPTTYDPPVKKIVTGDTPPTDEAFTFQMVAITEGAPMPEGTVDGVKTMTIVGAGEKEFGVMTFTEAGVYEYLLTEVAGSNENYSYDSTSYTLTVTVTEEDGQLVATGSCGDVEVATFTNTYTKPSNPPEPPKPKPTPKPTPKPPVVPKTGDETPQTGLIALLGAALLGYGVYRRRKA